MAVLMYPQIDPILFQLGPFAVRWYGLAYVAGLALGGLVVARLDSRWRMGLSRDQILDILIGAVLGLLIGARVGYAVAYGGMDFITHPLRVLAIWDGGMSFHGGLVGLVAAAWFVSRRLPVSFLRLCDAGAVGAPIGLLFGRLANFVNGELWGRTTDVPWGMVFPTGGPLPRHPSQLYEAGLEGIVLFAVMWWIARRKRPDGVQLGWFLVLYACFRIFAELFREPDPQLGFILGPVTMGQLLSVPMLLLGAWLVFRPRPAEK